MRHNLLLPTAAYLEHGQSGAPILGLAKVTASSILEVVILSSVGFLLARRGIIDKRTQTKINKLNVSFFTPALLFSKVAFTLNPARLAELIIVPLGFVIVTVVSTLSALLLSWISGLSKAQRNFAVACAISPNSNSLPVALMQSLVVTVPQLHWDEEGEPEDTVDGMLGRALTYLVLFSTLGMFLRWSVGAKLLSTVEEAKEEDGFEHDEPARQTSGSSATSSTNENGNGGAVAGSDSESVPRPSITLRRPTGERRPTRSRSGPPAWARSFPNSPEARASPRNSVPGEQDDSDVDDEPLEPYEEDGQITLPGASNSRENRSCWTIFKSKVYWTYHTFVLRPLLAIAGFMTAPLYAAVISLVVAMIPPLQKFVDSLEPVVGALETAGACSIPLTMVVLGAYFVADASAVKADQTMPRAVPPSAPAGDGSTDLTGPQPTYFKNADASAPGNGYTSDDDPWRRTSLDSSTASGQSTLVHQKDTKRKSLVGSWIGKNPWNSGSSSGGSDVEEARFVEEPRSYAANQGGAGSSGAPYSSDDVAARNADLNSRNGAGRWQNALTKQQASEKHLLKMERRTIAVAISSRMLLTPLILLPVVAWYAIVTASNVMDDPVFVASACLIIGSPPALTLAQITSQSASGNPSFERLISKTIFAAYAFLAAPTTILLVLTALLITENDKNK
ncbi:hypothetical protein BCV70DRAFT_197997 [Testicularia cyperi]|uniref:Auxin efflux carrier n=1 Tax=Testicularia cyperi TaxID=1882483 RepID=A0A317XZW6_9BASI|nr:hypothetical protein BCV70DRAFT_197997 [Testicularia cyperi]